MVTAVGLSNLQYVDLNSSRNIFILGVSIFFGFSMPEWMGRNQDAVDTGKVVCFFKHTVGILLRILRNNSTGKYFFEICVQFEEGLNQKLCANFSDHLL
jgi:xanthine/uracil permease